MCFKPAESLLVVIKAQLGPGSPPCGQNEYYTKEELTPNTSFANVAAYFCRYLERFSKPNA